MQASLERLQRRREELGDEGGFTLIELLIVIVILGILAAIVVFAVQNLTSSSAQAACKSDLKNVETAAEAYKAQMGNYPSGSSTAGGATAGATPNTDSALAAVNAAASGGELLTGSEVGTSGKDSNGNVTANIASPSGTAVGPWLKDVPSNGTHYTIWLANDGSGSITVGTGTVTSAPTATNCDSVS